MGDTIDIVVNLSKEGFEKGSQQLKSAIKSIGNSAKQFGGKMLKSVDGVKKSFGKLSGSAKGIIKSIIGVGSAYAVISKAVSAYMAQNKQLSAQMSGCWTAIGNLLGPIINQIISMVATAISYIISFLRLLGVTAKSASELSKSAEGAGGSISKTIAGFDELNTLQAGGGGGGGGGGTLADVDPSELIQNLADALNEGEFFKAGQLIGQELDKISGKIGQWFKDLDEQHYGKKFAEFINGFLSDKTVFEDLGKTTGDGLNLIIHAIDDFVTEFNGLQFGTDIAAYLNGIFDTVDFAAIGHSLGEGLADIGDTIIGFFTELDFGQIATDISDWLKSFCDTITNWLNDTDWREFGNTLYKNIKDFLTNVDWLGIAEAVFNLLGAVLQASVVLLFGFFEGIWNDIKEWWQSSGVGDWFNTHIITPIRDWFEHAINAIVRFFKKGWYYIQIGANYFWLAILKIAKAVALAFANAWDAIRYGASVIWWALETGFKKLINWIIDKINDWIQGLNDAFGWLGVNIEKIPRLTERPFEEVSEQAHDAANAVEEAFDGSIDGTEQNIADLQQKINDLDAEQLADNMDMATKEAERLASAVDSIPSSVDTTVNIKTNVSGGGGVGVSGAASPRVNVTLMKMAKGGVLNKPTIVEAGEAGKEAFVPLERNTEWISMVAKGLMDRLASQKYVVETGSSALSDIAKKIDFHIPSVANGSIVPYSVSATSGNVRLDGSEDAILALLAELYAMLSKLANDMENMQFVAQFDSIRALAKRITREQKRQAITEGR